MIFFLGTFAWTKQANLLPNYRAISLSIYTPKFFPKSTTFPTSSQRKGHIFSSFYFSFFFSYSSSVLYGLIFPPNNLLHLRTVLIVFGWIWLCFKPLHIARPTLRTIRRCMSTLYLRRNLSWMSTRMRCFSILSSKPSFVTFISNVAALCYLILRVE